MNAEMAACSRLASLDPCGTFEDLAPVLPHITALTRLVLDYCLDVTDRFCILCCLVIDQQYMYCALHLTARTRLVLDFRLDLWFAVSEQGFLTSRSIRFEFPHGADAPGARLLPRCHRRVRFSITKLK